MKRKLGFGYLSGAVLCSAAITAIFLQKVPIIENKPKVECQKTSEQSIVKGDFICDVKMGEADPFSQNYDFISCGSCGDGVRQIKSTKGERIIMDLDTSETTQAVTERESETNETCPVDFHCGDGRLDIGTPFSAVIFEDGAYQVAVVNVFESCNSKSNNFCADDCLKNKKPVIEIAMEDDTPKIPTAGVLTCTYQISGRNRVDLIGLSSIGGESLNGRLSSLVRSKSIAIRNVLGKTATDQIKILISMDVDSRGVITVTAVNGICDNKICDNADGLKSIMPINLDGLSLSAPGKQCELSLAFRVP